MEIAYLNDYFTEYHLSSHYNTFYKLTNPLGMGLHVPGVYLNNFYLNSGYGMDVVGVRVR